MIQERNDSSSVEPKESSTKAEVGSNSIKSNLPDRAKYFWPILIASVGLLSYIPWLGSYGPLDPTDSFFLESGRESVELNSYLLPLNNYVPWLDKPILFFWMVAGSYKLLGINVFAGRLPAAISAILSGLAIYAGCRPMLARNVAALAAIIFMANPLCSIIGHVCLTDMTLCLFLSTSILFLFKGSRFNSMKDLLIAYVSLALAVLNKGPIAIILCGLAFLPYMLSKTTSSKNFIQQFLSLKPLVGIAIVLLFNLPWYIAASAATNGEFLHKFFWEQNFGRMMGTVNHQGPFWFYIPVFFAGLFPWCLLFLSAPGILKSAWKKRTNPTAGEWTVSAHKTSDFIRLCICWFAMVMLLFTAIKTKLPTYILPAIPAFSILTAVQLRQFFKQSLVRKLFPSILISLVVVLGLTVTPLFLKGYLKDIATTSSAVLGPLALVISIYWSGLVQGKVSRSIWALCLCAAIACGFLVPNGLKQFYRARQVGFSNLIFKVKDANASIAMVSAEEPSIPWILHKPVSRLMSGDDARSYMEKQPAPHFVLIPEEMLARRDWFPEGCTFVAKDRKWNLFSIGTAGK